jgi:hypothetical protein
MTSKTNLNITRELTDDFEAVLANYPNATRGTFKTEHLQYNVYSIAMLVDDKIKRVDVYLDPGTSAIHFVHLTLHYTRRQPTQEELNAFSNLVKSTILTGQQH